MGIQQDFAKRWSVINAMALVIKPMSVEGLKNIPR